MSESASYLLPSSRCHCFGTGIVLMDDLPIAGAACGEPCPMCVTGFQRSGEFVTGMGLVPPPLKSTLTGEMGPPRDDVKPRASWRNRDGRYINQPNWYHGVDISVLSWNGGLTNRHRHECATIGCRGFVDEQNRRCASCVPADTSGRVPSYRAIIKAITAKKRGDARDVYPLALQMADEELAAAAKASRSDQVDDTERVA